MPTYFSLDWYAMFAPSKPILETIIRGSVTYLALFLLLRLFRRQTGSLGPADLLVLLLIADASQNAMANEYRAITDGIILVATIIGWEYALDYLGYHVPRFAKLLERDALQIVKNGEVVQDHLKRELITLDELLSHLREKGVDNPQLVSKAFVEGDGKISVILCEGALQRVSGDEESKMA